MMQLSKEQFEFATQILNTFDPQRLKVKDLDSIDKKLEQIKGDKWDRIVKTDELENEQAQVEQKAYDKERDEYLAKMIGCSKDHGKEIDLYGKTYTEKVLRIKSLLNEASKASDDLQKKAYYFAQSLLVFYYLIPETAEEEHETKQLQLDAHRGQAECLLRLKRYDEALQQVQLARSITRDQQECVEVEIEVLFETYRFDECKEILKVASQPVKEKWGGRVLEALRDHSV